MLLLMLIIGIMFVIAIPILSVINNAIEKRRYFEAHGNTNNFRQGSLVRRYDDLFFGLSIIGGFIIISASIAIIVMLAMYKNSTIAKDKIVILEEHNVSIENKMDQIVKEYLDHEIDIYGNIEVILILIPELKGNTIVEKQIDFYISNSEEIKQLKLNSASLSVYRWWLWFGN